MVVSSVSPREKWPRAGLCVWSLSAEPIGVGFHTEARRHGAWVLCRSQWPALVPIAFVRLLTNVSVYEHIEFEGEHFDEGFRADLIVNGSVIIELKSVEKVSPVHKKQLLTYLRLTDLKVGYLLNFGDVLMKDGIRRIINGKLEA